MTVEIQKMTVGLQNFCELSRATTASDEIKLLIKILRIKLNLKKIFSFSFVNGIIFILVYKLILRNMLKDSLINFISCPQSFDIYINKKINNLKFFFPLNRPKPKNISKNKTLLMIGNLKNVAISAYLGVVIPAIGFILSMIR